MMAGKENIGGIPPAKDSFPCLNGNMSSDPPAREDRGVKAFISRIIGKCRQNYQLTDWVYTLGIFLLVTFILTCPLYMANMKGVLFLFLPMVIIGFLVALFTAYILTPISLRHFRPYGGDPVIPQYLKELSYRAGIGTPKLLVADTPEINAFAFASILGGRVCLTRGLLDAYHRGRFSADELKAIMGHEIGHIKHGDCFKWSFILSWLSIFDFIGTIFLVLGTAFIAAGAVTTVLSHRDNPGPIIAIMGVGMVILGVLQRILGKIASIPAFHLSRRHEFAADQEGARLTSTDVQVSALQKIDAYNHHLEPKKVAQLPFADRWQTAPLNMSWIDSIFSTHPPIEKRVGALQQEPESALQLPEDAAPVEKNIPPVTPPVPHAVTPPAPGVVLADTVKEPPGKVFQDTVQFPPEKSGSDMRKVPWGLKQDTLQKKVLVPVLLLGMLLAGIFFIDNPVGQQVASLPISPAQPGDIPVPPPTRTTAPTPVRTPALTPTQTLHTPVPTSLPVTVPPKETRPVSLGQSAKISLPHSESLTLGYNTVYRTVSSPSMITITYNVVANQVSDLKEIYSPSGDSVKRITYNDPNAYLVITVRDGKSKDVISTNGFGKQYASTPNQKVVVRRTGDLEIEVTGARVKVELAVS